MEYTSVFRTLWPHFFVIYIAFLRAKFFLFHPVSPILSNVFFLIVVQYYIIYRLIHRQLEEQTLTAKNAETASEEEPKGIEVCRISLIGNSVVCVWGKVLMGCVSANNDVLLVPVKQKSY